MGSGEAAAELTVLCGTAMMRNDVHTQGPSSDNKPEPDSLAYVRLHYDRPRLGV